MAGYIGTQAVSVNTTSATISDDLSVGDDLTVTDDATIGGTLGVTGVLTGTSLDISGDIDVDGTTNLDVVNAVGAFSVTGTRAGDFLAKITSSNTFGLLVKTTSTSASHEQVQFVDANDSVLFKVLGNGAATIKNGLTLTDGNLTVASGHGIDFAATGNITGTDAEILSDYEEGAWTPTLSGQASITYATQTGMYNKIGNLVIAKFFLTTNAYSGQAALLAVASLPFTVANNQSQYGGGVCLVDNLSALQANIFLQPAVNTTIANYIINNGTTGSHGGMLSNIASVNSVFRGTIIYTV